MMSQAADGGNEDTMQVDEMMEVVIKPRNLFTSSALRRAVPQTDIKKKRESLTMSMINIYNSGSIRLFQPNNDST